MDDKITTNFLKDTEWANARIEWRKADWSPRDFARLYLDDKTAILLKSPPDNSPDSMIGHQLGRWVKVQAHFKSMNLNVPNIYANDLNQGLVLMQDFGDETIADRGLEAYLKATDILIAMRDHPNGISADLIRYEDSHVYKALRFYSQFVLGDDALTDQWFQAWQKIEDTLPPCPRSLTHMDFAAMNLMWYNGKIGIIDFQAACNGPSVYDIVNLLEDIRRDIPEDIKKACKDKYRESLTSEDKESFDAWYPIITAQFYARILGQIQFLSQEKGRTDLMQYYKSTESRLEKLLRLPKLSPILPLIKDA